MEVNESNEKKSTVYSTKHAIVERLTEIVQNAEVMDKGELDALKQNFYKLHFAELEKARQEYADQGGDAATFITPADEDEVAFKAQFALIKERRNAQLQEMEQMRQENYEKKLQIVERIRTLLENPEEANQAYQEVKELQNQWKEIGSVPPEKASDLWKSYQLFVEQYYDILKINNEFREYDFKKNLEIKTQLCEAAEKLTEAADVVSAAHQLQQLHQDFRDCGPVAPEYREEIWKRFKEASTIVNKRHQQHFEDIKAAEESNLQKKTAICEQIEQYNAEPATSAPLWNELAQKVLALQAEWKTIGFASQKMNVKIYERYRQACDTFFTAKSNFFKEFKTAQSENLKKKQELCEKAEALMESTDWKSTTDAIIQLQKQWKEIGVVAKKDSDEIWKRFTAACDSFFEKKNSAQKSQRSEEHENLTKKKDIIARVKALKDNAAANMQQGVQELIKEWNAVGHVPFKEKDKVHVEFHELVDEVYKAIRQQQNNRHVNKFKENLKNAKGGALKERDRLMHTYETLKNELKTYENNIGFLTSTSKKGNSLVNEISRKIDKLKGDIEVVVEKIKAIDEKN